MPHIRFPGSLTFVALGLSVLAPAWGAAPRPSSLAQSVNPAVCTPFDMRTGPINDYRARAATDWMKFQYEDNWSNHTAAAIERVRQHDFLPHTIADLNFTLRIWPNHVVALQTLMKYYFDGGKFYEYPPIECYFEHAKKYRSDDIAVFVLEGQFYAKLKDFERAEKSFTTALQLDANSADAHYNLGLIEFERKNYDAALEHAQVAYAAGYPLPGLRKKLEGLGKWRDPPPARTADSTPAPAQK